MNSDRRSFLKASAGAGGSFIGAAAASAQPTFAPSFAHQVFSWLKNPDDRSIYDAVVGSLREFRAIKGVRFVHVGTPSVSASPGESSVTDATYTLSYLVLVESRKDEATYLAHPLYARFLDRFKDAFSKTVVYDSAGIDAWAVECPSRPDCGWGSRRLRNADRARHSRCDTLTHRATRSPGAERGRL